MYVRMGLSSGSEIWTHVERVGTTLQLWDGVTGAPVVDALTGHSHWVESVAFSPDGTRIVSGSDDETLRLWDGVTGAPRRALGSHSDSIARVAFSSDGTSVRSESVSKEVCYWDVASFERIRPQREAFTLPPVIQLSEKSGWLTIDDRKIVWVPERYRENAVCAYSEHGYIAIANKLGFVLINGMMLDWWKASVLFFRLAVQCLIFSLLLR
jgi:WD40 repeat protein